MNLHELTPGEGVKRQKRRVGRGHGSGRVKTSGRGTKGQNSRSGGGTRLGFEGGQNPWTMRIPHRRGFNIGRFRKTVQVLNLKDLEKYFESGASVTLTTLRERGLIDDVSGKEPVKLLGQGSLSKKLTLEVHYASRSARAAVEQAGGTLNLLRQVDEPAESAADSSASDDVPAADAPAEDAPAADDAER